MNVWYCPEINEFEVGNYHGVELHKPYVQYPSGKIKIWIYYYIGEFD